MRQDGMKRTVAEPTSPTGPVDARKGKDVPENTDMRASMEDIEMGPIDYIVVEWPPDKPPNGEAFPHLLNLVEGGLIRVLDLAFVQKDKDGNVVAIDIQDLDLDGNPEIAIFEGASSGLLGKDDVDEAGEALQAGSSAAILLYENTWAAPFATALRRSGAQLVATGRIPVNALLSALDEVEAAGS
jgi:hypothetical protein